jgi:hypothetical protein
MVATVMTRLMAFHADSDWVWTDEILLSAEEATYLKRWHFWELSDQVVPMLVDLVQRDIERNGWRNPPSLESAAYVQEKARSMSQNALRDGRFTSLSRTGATLMRAHFTAYWKTQGGALETCLDAKKLNLIIAYRVGVNDRGEVWDFTRGTLFRGLISSRKVPSLFKPVPAAAIYRKWLGDTERPVVWDPSGGFGGRMLGFYAVYPDGHYIANEPASLTALELRAFLGQGEIIENGSEVEGPTRPVDMVFTSPPYFNKERYFDEPGQCWRDYPTETEWMSRYLQPTIQRGADALKRGGYLVLNVDEDRRVPVMECAKNARLEFVTEDELHIGVDHFGRRLGKGARTEPILAFKKTGQKMAVCVPGTSGRYTISSEGEVRSYTQKWHGSSIGGTVMSTGYRSVGITAEAGGKSRTHLVHRLVCAAFHGDPPSAGHTDVRHLNGDKTDNRAVNLAWGTRSENMLDVVRHRALPTHLPVSQGSPKQEWYGGRTSDLALVRVAVALVHEGKIEVKDVARLLDCSETVASNLVSGRTLSGALEGVRTTSRKRRTPARRLRIRDLIADGLSRDEVNSRLDETLTHQEFYYYRGKK